MKPLFLIGLLLIAATVVGQSLGYPLRFTSWGISLGVGKDGCLAMGTKVGEVGLTNSITGNWRRVDVADAEEIANGADIETTCFFNKDTGFVSGTIYSKKERNDIIYHTTDGGSKWNIVKIGQNGPADDAVYNDNGEAWLSIAGSGIAYSTDYGLNWKKFRTPDAKQRFAHIFFNTNRQGIIGSLWNLIAYTTNNCDSWKYLPTPLDQKKYNKTNKEARPEINRVAIFKDHFLVAQENMVFYSKRDSINWVWLPEFSDFYTDAGNSALFFKTNKGNFVRADDNFNPVHTLEVAGTSYDARCRNGSLYVVSNSKMIQLTPENAEVSTLFEEKTIAAKEPVPIGFRQYTTVGYMDNKIFERKLTNGSWKYLFTLPILLDSNHVIGVIRENKLLYYHGTDSLFYFDFTGSLIKKTTREAMFTGFIKSGIKQLVFSKGNAGCFHFETVKLQYTKLGDEFGEAIESGGTVDGKGMPNNEDRIDAKEVSDFLSKIPAIFNNSRATTIEDLGFSESDYSQCKKDILAFQQRLLKNEKSDKWGKGDFVFDRNNLDFDWLLHLVDSVKFLDTNVVHFCMMALYNDYGTTSYWEKIEFVNYDNEVLSVTNTYSGFPNAFHFPWMVSLNGFNTMSIDMNINRFIDKVYPSFLQGKSKVRVLHEMVKGLY